MKLPKQWLHWAQKAGLRREHGWRGSTSAHYLFGRGRRWRVDCNGVFECSCPTEYFDRWANSHGAQSPKLPTTEAEFLIAVRDMHARSKDAR